MDAAVDDMLSNDVVRLAARVATVYRTLTIGKSPFAPETVSATTDVRTLLRSVKNPR